ncbi:MAG: PEP-CTERM sorting domain-containing protein [Phycisphaerales bacterium]|nr:PEP-CTERM sorting domain-containing protein [Phycisphaerales bacterium]
MSGMRIPVCLSVIVGLALPRASVGEPVAPCTAGLAGETIIPLTNEFMNYCVSDFGWSDAWLIPARETYSRAVDVLSGDDAANFQYKKNGIPSAGKGWLTPGLDAGALSPRYHTGSPWQVFQPVSYTEGTTKAESVIRHPEDGIVIKITSEISGLRLSQRYDIQNVGTSLLEDLVFADYFNYHPNGTDAGNHFKGTIRYEDGRLITTGIDDGTLIADGMMWGQRMDDFHGVGIAAEVPGDPGPGDVITMIETQSYDGSAGPFGPNDAAGGLAWKLGDLGQGQSTSFTIFKAAPEPSTLGLLTLGSLVLLRRRR